MDGITGVLAFLFGGGFIWMVGKSMVSGIRRGDMRDDFRGPNRGWLDGDYRESGDDAYARREYGVRGAYRNRQGGGTGPRRRDDFGGGR